jgi:UDP:flavonoid glycosyltransferase YjiC (YdhE family)
MGKNNVVFMMPMLFGHANRTIKIGRLLQNKDFDVYYAGSVQLLRFTLKNNFNLFTLHTTPIQKPSFKPFTLASIKDWLSIVHNSSLFNDYLTRKNELKSLIDKLQPSIIFLDEFCYFDYIILRSLSTNCNIYILQGKMGMYFNENSPPSNSYSFPNRFTKYLWEFTLLRNKLKRTYQECIFAGQTIERLSKKIMASKQINTTISFNYKKIFTPSFIGIPELLLYAPEFDFPDNTPLAWQRYLTPSVDLERKEIITDKLKNFIEKGNSEPSSRIIYCSLGTVADIHLGQTALKTDFINKCLQIAENNPTYYFIISSGDDLNKEVDGQIFTDNALVLNFAPQVFILKRADLFVTHGGRNSIFEGIYTETPMLICPLNKVWDQNGNAARAVYHQVGIKANINDSIEKIEEQIFTLLTDKSYKDTVTEMAKKMKQKYTDENLSDQLDKIMSLK